MDWLWWAQMAADALLVAAVALLLFRLRGRSGPQDVAANDDLGKFISEAGQLSQEFDRLLAEKRDLVNTTLATLDQRIQAIEAMLDQARQIAQRLEQAQSAAAPPATPKAPPPIAASGSANDFRRKVEELHRMGRTAEQIVQATGRPRGEVDLALGLLAGEG